MNSLAQYVRWLVLALCTVATLALNHQRVATWRVAVPKAHGTTVTAGKNVLVVRERVVLPTLPNEATVAFEAPASALLPLDPLSEWLTTLLKVRGAWRNALPAAIAHGTALGANLLTGRLLGSSLSPQAP